jgi:hypothetical protein
VGLENYLATRLVNYLANRLVNYLANRLVNYLANRLVNTLSPGRRHRVTCLVSLVGLADYPW